MMLIMIGPGVGIPGGMTPATTHVIEATGRPPTIMVGCIVDTTGPGAGPAARSPRHETGIPWQINVGHPGPVTASPIAFNPVSVAIGVMSVRFPLPVHYTISERRYGIISSCSEYLVSSAGT